MPYNKIFSYVSVGLAGVLMRKVCSLFLWVLDGGMYGWLFVGQLTNGMANRAQVVMVK